MKVKEIIGIIDFIKNQIEKLITMVADILVLVTFDFFFKNETTME